LRESIHVSAQASIVFPVSEPMRAKPNATFYGDPLFDGVLAWDVWESCVPCDSRLSEVLSVVS
jgi:hypothetical protein